MHSSTQAPSYVGVNNIDALIQSVFSTGFVITLVMKLQFVVSAAESISSDGENVKHTSCNTKMSPFLTRSSTPNFSNLLKHSVLHAQQKDQEK